MKKILIIFILVVAFSPMRSYCQKKNKLINFIIVIDDKVVVGSSQSFQFIVNGNKNKNRFFEADYIPGKLSLDKVDFEKLLSSQVKSFFLAFDYNEFYKGEQIIHNYKIELDKIWLQYDFIILKVYNLDKRKYQEIFDPIEGCNYTYEMECPDFSISRVRKKFINEDCNK
jgi:hypothetical protein